jgi:phosphopantetheinyl transferase
MPFIPVESYIAGVSLGLWRISEPESFFLGRLSLYENEVRRLEEISHPMARLEWLSSRLCLKELLKINHEVESLNFLDGRPYLSDHSYRISYSHSTKYAAAIASKQKAVAIDLEYLKRNRNLETRFLFMNDEELEAYEESRQRLLFFLIWSSKETLYKVYGKRGIAFKHNIHIDVKNVEFGRKGKLNGSVTENGLRSEYEIHYRFYPELVLTYTASLVREPEVRA